MARANSPITQQSEEYAELQLSKGSGLNVQKTLIKLPHTEMAETDHSGVQIEHLNKSKSGLEQQNIAVRDCPSLVGGRPAKSVVERPRGFKSHIPRHFLIQLIFATIFNNYDQIFLRNYGVPI